MDFLQNPIRALSDVQALVHLLSLQDSKTLHPYLKELLDNARRPMIELLRTTPLLRQRTF